MIDLTKIDVSCLVKGHERYIRSQSGGINGAVFNSVKNRALDGQCIQFDKKFYYEQRAVIYTSGCLGDVHRSRVGFWIDHLDSSEVASTDDGLVLILDDDRLQFRLDLEKTDRGFMIARLCEIGSRAEISIGSNILAEHNETIGGEVVRVVTRAKLTEVSLVKEGAVGHAFASLVDTTRTPWPVAGKTSTTFATNMAIHNISRKLRSMKAALVGDHRAEPVEAYAKRSFTLNESNRWTTDEHERRVAEKRMRNRF